MTEIRDEGNLPCYQQGLYSSSEKQPPAKLNPAHRGSSALLRAYYISQTRSCLAYTSALPSVTKGKKPVGSKKWSHKPHPDHRQCLAYITCKLKTFLNKTDLSNVQNKFLPIAILHQIYSFWVVKYYEMIELAELKVYKNYYLSNIHFIHKHFWNRFTVYS